MKAILAGSGVCVAESVEVADTFWCRAIGLMFRRQLPAGRAMLITRCNGIHTFCMRFPLDLLFLDGECKVVKISRSITPFRMEFGGPGGRSVLEMTAGWLPPDAVRVGDVVELKQ